jgi:ribonuclease VapC
LIVDASALVAILLREPEADAFLNALDQKGVSALTHPVSLWEAVRGVARGSGMTIAEAKEQVLALFAAARIRVEHLGSGHALSALEAAALYGMGTKHPAQLNLGDCFTYAVAMHNRGPILYKGNDFKHTRLGSTSETD